MFTSNWLLQDLCSSNPLKGIVPHRPKNEKYKKMILGLATAIEKHPYSLTRASKYLREWVEEKLVLVAPLQVDIIQQVNPDFRGRQRPVTSFHLEWLVWSPPFQPSPFMQLHRVQRPPPK